MAVNEDRKGTSAPKPHVAFVAAAMILLVLPLLVIAGLSALGIVAHTEMMSRMMNGDAVGVWMVMFLAWGLVVLAVVLLLIRRLVGQTRA